MRISYIKFKEEESGRAYKEALTNHGFQIACLAKIKQNPRSLWIHDRAFKN